MTTETSYSDFDRERFVAEAKGSRQARTEFARDRARVLHSSALRRLGAKTQVLSPGWGDFARTRLTHSLEVAQVGREMATELGVDPDIVDTACLSHDLGHPPFGHNGEKALNVWAKNFGGFEGNAQTLRLLSRIEPKVFSSTGESAGLNLTRASLDAACKYPWTIENAVQDQGADRSVKFGVYADDVPVFEWLRIGSPERAKCIEAQIMDFSDDVAYSVHDFEDAVVEKFVQLNELSGSNSTALISEIERWNGGNIARADLELALIRLQANPFWQSTWDASMRSAATLKNLTSSVIGSFVGRTTEATLAHHQGPTIVRFGANVVVPADVEAEIAIFKGIVSFFLMSHESRRPHYEWQRLILTELADALLSQNGDYLDAYSTAAWLMANDEVSKHRVIVDQIANLTDSSVLKLHDVLVGSKKRIV
jgi:dGTPase